MHGPLPLTSPPDIMQISHPSSSRMINQHNPLNSSLSRRGQPRPQSCPIRNESTQLDDNSQMDEVKTNSNYNVNSYISGIANKYNTLLEHLPASCPCQFANQKWPRYYMLLGVSWCCLYNTHVL